MNKKLEKAFERAELKLRKLNKDFELELLLEYKKSLIRVQNLILKAFEKAGIISPIGKGVENSGQHFVEMQKYDRLAILENQIAEEIKKLTGISLKLIGTQRKTALKIGYEAAYEAINSTLPIEINFTRFDPNTISQMIKNPLDRKSWGKRLKGHHETAYDQIIGEISHGLQTGRGYSKTAAEIEPFLYKIEMVEGKQIVKGLGGRALRLVRTETHRIQVLGRNEAIDQSIKNGKKLGIQLVKVISSVLDSRTRPQSEQMHGQMADKDGLFRYPNGVRALPGSTGIKEYDINDRETIIVQEKSEYLAKIKI